MDDVLRPHLEAASQGNQKAAGVVRAGLEALASNQGLLLLRIQDSNAHGLIGPEYDTGLFTAVCRNTLDSQKASESAGGSYGLGKAVMWTSSRLGLVITNSTLSVPQEGKRDNRLFGRIELPWHEAEGESWAGPGWYGEVDPQRGCTRSYWSSPILAEDLYVPREGLGPGTTLLIVGAFDPSGTATTAEDIAQSLEVSLGQNFWPAMMERGQGAPPRLKASVRTFRGRKQLTERLIDPEDQARPFVEALRRHYDDDVVDKLDEPGDVVRDRVPLRVSPRNDDVRPEVLEHQAVVLIAQAPDSSDGEDGTPVNKVARFRGNQMVIESQPLQGMPLGARPCYVIVLAGEAAGDAATDRLAERFLRAAEPPAHNKWTSTTELTALYRRGAKKALDDFRDAVRECVRSHVSVAAPTSSDGPESLKQLLRLVPPSEPPAKRPRVKEPVEAILDDDGTWHIQAAVTLPTSTRGWQFRPVLRFGTESGAPISVGWVTLEPVSHCSVSGRKVIANPSARSLSFRGDTDPSTYPAPAKHARVMLDLLDVREAGRP